MIIITTPNTADYWACYWYEVFVKSVSNHNVIIIYFIINVQWLNSQFFMFNLFLF